MNVNNSTASQGKGMGQIVECKKHEVLYFRSLPQFIAARAVASGDRPDACGARPATCNILPPFGQKLLWSPKSS